jgi:CheY-like chemotaxis protein
VLVNLVGNAIKFTPAGEVVLNVRCSDCRDHVAQLCFEIRDTGVGIPEEKLDQIFAEFEQADTSTTREYGGTGLGLSISSRLVELMGGRIQVESVVGQGSRFYFTLPLRVAEEGPAPVERDRDVLRGVPILIVDDNATNRRIQRETVQGWSMNACEADSGPAAVSLLRDMHSRSELPRVVLSDVHMPNMDGFMLADEIRRTFAKDSIALILLTSGGAIRTQSQLAAVGVDALLTKPVKQSELLDILLRAVGPIVKASPSPAKPCESEPCSGSSPTSGPLRVLLAEDGLANQKLAIGLLEKWGHQVTVATDGMAAVTAWETGGFDLILMDIQMPELDGIAATEIIRQRERALGRRMPIIAMTAHALSGDRQRCLDAGMDGYISKPVRRADLEQAMLELFS